MPETYLGRLDLADPLYEILLSQVCRDIKDPLFHVNRISSRLVYKYTEERTRTAIIGKFFELHDKKQERVIRKKGEYDNLLKIRNFGFDTFPNYVVKPIGREDRIGLALIEEFILGKDLDHYLKKAIYEGEGNTLRDRLSRLAAFLYFFHSRTETENTVCIDPVCAYFLKIIGKLLKQRVISDGDRNEYVRMMDKWMNRRSLQKAKNVMVHGDATPTNFIFTEEGEVVAIDLERMKNSDLMFDVGMVCGELKHAFLWRTGNPFASEPYIRHFLKNYAGNFCDDKRTFREITLRNPFYMAMTELRIARNDYLEWNYRRRLALEAMGCLKWGFRLR